MTDPLSLYHFALAAGGGRIDGVDVPALVAAGVTLLQRSAPLVRALAGRRAAVLLPLGPGVVVAMAASDGRGAVFLDPQATNAELAHQMAEAGVGAVFTMTAMTARFAPATTLVLLDDAPRSARVRSGELVRDVDLGSHHGLMLEGARDAIGLDEECGVECVAGKGSETRWSHREILARAHAIRAALGLTPDDHTLVLAPFAPRTAMLAAVGAPLLAGGQVTTMTMDSPHDVMAYVEAHGVTAIVGDVLAFDLLVQSLDAPGIARTAPHLRNAACLGGLGRGTLAERFRDATGVALRDDL